MVTEQQTLANPRSAADSETAKPHSHNAEIASRAFTGNRPGHKVGWTFDFQKRITREALYPFRISGLSNRNDKNRKSENAKRSEPNIGQIPGRAGPAKVQSCKGFRPAGQPTQGRETDYTATWSHTEYVGPDMPKMWGQRLGKDVGPCTHRLRDISLWCK
jgi:hypothetical protein